MADRQRAAPEDVIGMEARWPSRGACLMTAYVLRSRAVCCGPSSREIPGSQPAAVCHGPPVRA
jgi:hypothetical protein